MKALMKKAIHTGFPHPGKSLIFFAVLESPWK